MRPESLSLWDEHEAVIPPRSRLYHLEMQSSTADTLQESLLSYLHRVAVAHTVPVWHLLRMEVVALTAVRSARFSTGFAQDYSRTVNGYGKYAEEIASSLEKLTLTSNLRCGTFLHWRALFDPKGIGLLARVPRWCPSCLADQQARAEVVVLPLVWSLAPVTICLKHRASLQSTCPACGGVQRFISDSVSRGRCCNCGSRLGCREGLWTERFVSEREFFVAEAVTEMVRIGSEAAVLADQKRFGSQIIEVAARFCEGGTRGLEREIGFRKRSIYRWTALGMCPQFDQFLELCFRIGIKPINLLDGSWKINHSESAFRKDAVPVRRRNHGLIESAFAALKADVERIVSEKDSFEDAVAVAKRHGISVRGFKYRYPDLYAVLAGHRLAVRERLRQQRLDRQEARIVELVRLLHRTGTRLTRSHIEVAMLQAGMTLKDPVARGIAFKERAVLESQAGSRFRRTASLP